MVQIEKQVAGGGGQGYSWTGVTLTTPRGGNGTSYSGGSGAGTIYRHGWGYGEPPIEKANGSDTGGPGGNSYRYWDYQQEEIAGGIGNPSGISSGGNKTAVYGTGGLLIIQANEISNDGIISSDGSTAVALSNGYSMESSGSGSGGGSINIFYKKLLNKGTINANGGGGRNSGGKGSITLTEV